jgi:hypothetical protein
MFASYPHHDTSTPLVVGQYINRGKRALAVKYNKMGPAYGAAIPAAM